MSPLFSICMTLSPGAKGPAEPLDLAFARRVQRRLKFNVKGAGADAASVHRAEHLDIADWIETEAARDAGFSQAR
jgi:hypothetical protein